MILRLTNGTTTINLTASSDIKLEEGFVPQSPSVSTVEFTSEALQDGGELFEITRRNVTESIKVTITGSTIAAVQTSINGVEALFRQAEQMQRRGLGGRVWVEYRPGDSGDVYRSEILYGKVEPSEKTATPGYFADVAISALIVWRRRYYWEASTETEISLTNAHGTGTGGITVYNHDDSGHDNYVAIAAASVTGVLPAPARIEITNTYNDSHRTSNVMIAQNVFSYPSTFTHVLEGESADYIAGGAASTANAACSGGYLQTVTWAGDTEAQAIRWALSAAMLGAAAGNFFRILARFTVSPSGVRITPKITFPSGTPITTVAESQEILLDSTELQSLGVLQIPPWLPNETSLIAVDFALYARKTGGGSLYIDYALLVPLDGFRVLKPRGYGLPYTYKLIDDGITDVCYVLSGSSKAGYYVGTGKPIALWPGKDQRLYFMATNDVSDAEIERTHSVRIYYRPRRLTL